MTRTSNSRHSLFLLLPLLLAGGVFFGCHDPIFEDINEESAINDERIKGGATSFVRFNGSVYIAPANRGALYRKSLSRSHERGDWEKIEIDSDEEVPVFLAVSGGTLYMLTTIFENGSGASEGINLPMEFREYTSSSGDSGSWTKSEHTYDSDLAGSDIPAMYKNQHTKVSSSAGTYSIDTNTNVLYLNNNAILYADQSDVRVGSWWCIAGTRDQLILGTSAGLYHMPIGSTDINNEVAPNDYSTAKSIFSGMTILALYTAGSEWDSSDRAWSCASTSETDSVIYVFATGSGSAYAAQNGLYSYIPGKGWDSEF